MEQVGLTVVMVVRTIPGQMTIFGSTSDTITVEVMRGNETVQMQVILGEAELN